MLWNCARSVVGWGRCHFWPNGARWVLKPIPFYSCRYCTNTTKHNKSLASLIYPPQSYIRTSAFTATASQVKPRINSVRLLGHGPGSLPCPTRDGLIDEQEISHRIYHFQQPSARRQEDNHNSPDLPALPKTLNGYLAWTTLRHLSMVSHASCTPSRCPLSWLRTQSLAL
jgi:hypothetical protein